MFKIGVVQNSPKFLKAKENVAACLELMDRLDADLWVLPELFASGYNFKNKKKSGALRGKRLRRSNGRAQGLDRGQERRRRRGLS